MRALLIVNPHATSTTPRRRDLLTHALASEVQLVVAHTTGRGHAAELAATAAADGLGLVVVHAGDGTVNEAVNGLLSLGVHDSAPMLAVVPGGSTNVFARALGIDPDPTQATEQILEALQARRFRRIALGLADERYFTFNAGLGLDAAVVAEVEKHRAAGKKISNSMHIREMLKTYAKTDRRTGRITVSIPGQPDVTGCHLAFVSNVSPWTYAGRFPVRTNPGTTPEGGLGIFAARTLRPSTVGRIGTQLFRRHGHPHSKYLLRLDNVPNLTLTSEEPMGFQLDGDYLGLRQTVEFRSIPAALRVAI